MPVGTAVELRQVQVSDGRFAAALDLSDAKALERDAERWVEVAVRDSGAKGGFATLDARQKATLATTACAAWDVLGNAGTSADFNFVGTTDPVPLTLRTNNQGAMQYEYVSNFNGPAVNVLGVPVNNQVPSNPGGRPVGVVVAGGGDNTQPNKASEDFATVAGGANNNIQRGFGANVGDPPVGGVIAGGRSNLVTAQEAAISGGNQNAAPGDYAAVPGGQFNVAGGFYSFAGGRRARVRTPIGSGIQPEGPDADGDEGSFIWGDSTNAAFETTGPNQFLVRANGGFGINTNFIGNFADMTIQARSGISGGDADADIQLLTRNLTHAASIFLKDSNGGLGFAASSYSLGNVAAPAGVLLATTANGANLTTGGVWTNGSSRTFKQDFTAIDPTALLGKVIDLPITTWHYKNSDEGWHMGPMAEDFYAAFGLGGDDKHIGTVDSGGVALAAVQGLNAKLETDNARLADANASLEARLERLAADLAALAARVDAVPAASH
jgi:hypothetical protein